MNAQLAVPDPLVETEVNVLGVIGPDLAPCPDCLAEMADPGDRRYRYPFTTCAACGPRLTVTERLPYQRDGTSMAGFDPCPECAAEYRDPSGRRYRDELVSCPACGPQLALRERNWSPSPGDPLEVAAARLRAGTILAIKGVGGYELTCDATDDDAVRELRRRTRRPEAPFAVMVGSPEQARVLFDLAPSEAAALDPCRAPILLLKSRGLVAPSVAPGFREHGAMLPPSALHHLLVKEAGVPLVLTGGNRWGEAACLTDPEARTRLAAVADAFLVHDRDIAARIEPSIDRMWRDRPRVLRRARGHAPQPIPLLEPVAPVLGVGADRHGTFALARDDRAYLVPRPGGRDAEDDLARFGEAVARSAAWFGIEPVAVARDLDLALLTSRVAEGYGVPTVTVQHHHAHVAAVMAEYALTGPVLGVVFDGGGLGTDGTMWGGEFLVVRQGHVQRVAHLRAVAQPGGVEALRRPGRMALAYAVDAGVTEEARKLLAPDRRARKAQEEMDQTLEAIAGGSITSSAARLFDAVSALAGVCREATFDGQPAILLEQVAQQSATFEYGFDLDPDPTGIVVDVRPTIVQIVKDLYRGIAVGEVAGRFHRTLSAAVAAVSRLVRVTAGVETVVLAGGVFANDLLVSDTEARLRAFGFDVHVPSSVPVGAGGLSLGQAYVAGRLLLGDEG